MTATSSTHPFLSFRQAVKLRVAVADTEHTLKRVAALTPGQTTVGAPHEWYRTVGIRLLTDLASGAVSTCPHLGPGRGFGPMYCVLRANTKVQCRSCFSAASPRLSPVDDLTCDRCSVYARGLVSGALPVGPLLLIFGVCGACSTELGISVGRDAAA